MLFLKENEMPIPGIEYYWRRTEGWKYFGEDRWWEVFVRFHDGMNGGGGAYVYIVWRQNGDNGLSEVLRTDHKNMSLQETRDLISELVAAGNPVAS